MAADAAPTLSFRAVIQLHKPNPYVDVPPRVAAALEPWARARRIKVEGTLGRAPFRATVLPVSGGGHRLYVNGGMRAAANVGVGDEVSITLRPTSEEEVNPPPDIAAVLDAAGAKHAFDGLAPSHRRELLRYIDDARSPATRAKRIRAAIDTFAGGLPANASPTASGRAACTRPMWTCPACGNQFVTRNQSHSCARHDLADALAGKPAFVRDLFERVRTIVESFGPVNLVAYRDRVAFMVRVRFAGVTPKARWLDLALWLAGRVESDRWHRVETLTPAATIHVLRLTAPDQLDAEVVGWLAQAYAIGCQEHLRA